MITINALVIDAGRITLPRTLRKKYDIQKGDTVEIKGSITVYHLTKKEVVA